MHDMTIRIIADLRVERASKVIVISTTQHNVGAVISQTPTRNSRSCILQTGAGEQAVCPASFDSGFTQAARPPGGIWYLISTSVPVTVAHLHQLLREVIPKCRPIRY